MRGSSKFVPVSLINRTIILLSVFMLVVSVDAHPLRKRCRGWSCKANAATAVDGVDRSEATSDSSSNSCGSKTCNECIDSYDCIWIMHNDPSGIDNGWCKQSSSSEVMNPMLLVEKTTEIKTTTEICTEKWHKLKERYPRGTNYLHAMSKRQPST
jgi:hypothetical protein